MSTKMNPAPTDPMPIVFVSNPETISAAPRAVTPTLRATFNHRRPVGLFAGAYVVPI